ncbi:MAG: DUF1214 domain-containing protein [Parvibaculaceae bacterium]
MRGVVKLAAMCLLGALLGLITAWLAISGRYALVSKSKGPWTVWAAAGTPQIDPYTRAHFLLDGRLPISHFEALEYEARTDDDGRALSGACVYRIVQPKVSARWWSLAAIPKDRTESEAPEDAAAILSQRAVYEADGTLNAVLSPEARPGNWLKTTGEGGFVLLFRVYNVEPSLRAAPLSLELPSIRREACL